MADVEFAILDFIQEHLKNGFGDFIMPLISALSNKGIIWLIVGIALCISKKHRKSGIIVITSLVFMTILCNITLKPLVARTRPFIVNEGIKLLVNAPSGYSFPSGHASASFSATFALLFNKNKLWIPSMILSVLIAFSRLYLYVHYPTDVLCGAIIGLVAGLLANTICEKHFKKSQAKSE